MQDLRARANADMWADYGSDDDQGSDQEEVVHNKAQELSIEEEVRLYKS